MHEFLFYNEFTIHLYMFRAQLCPSSGGKNCITQHLASSHSAGGRPEISGRVDNGSTEKGYFQRNISY